MIDYAYLCQAIADARAGRRPTPPPSATPTLPGSGVSSTAPIQLGAEFGAESQPAAAAQFGYSGADAVESDDQDEGIESADIETMDALAGDDGDYGADAGFAEVPPAAAPADYDSSIAYGTSDGMPRQTWAPAQAGGEVEPDIETEVELDADIDVDIPRNG